MRQKKKKAQRQSALVFNRSWVQLLFGMNNQLEFLFEVLLYILHNMLMSNSISGSIK